MQRTSSWPEIFGFYYDLRLGKAGKKEEVAVVP